jgi:hypothetical protein
MEHIQTFTAVRSIEKVIPSLATIWKVVTGRYERTDPSNPYNIITL